MPELLALLNPRIESVEVAGAPAALAGPLSRFLRGESAGAGFSARAAELAQRFPALQAVHIRRDWLGHRARVEVTLRRALGRALRGGRPAGFLDPDGVVFRAPETLYPEARLVLEVGDADAARLQALAEALDVLSRDGNLPAPMERLSYRSAYDGWEVFLRDGTKVLWGDLSWTREKLARLREALAEARGRFPGALAAASSRDGVPLVADLRYFEDGRVLLRPLSGDRF